MFGEAFLPRVSVLLSRLEVLLFGDKLLLSKVEMLLSGRVAVISE